MFSLHLFAKQSVAAIHWNRVCLQVEAFGKNRSERDTLSGFQRITSALICILRNQITHGSTPPEIRLHFELHRPHIDFVCAHRNDQDNPSYINIHATSCLAAGHTRYYTEFRLGNAQDWLENKYARLGIHRQRLCLWINLQYESTVNLMQVHPDNHCRMPESQVHH